MGKMVQIRNMPDKTHRILKSRAAAAGMSLSDYLLAELKKSSERLTKEELLARLEKLPPVKMKLTSAQIIREMRDRDDRR